MTTDFDRSERARVAATVGGLFEVSVPSLDVDFRVNLFDISGLRCSGGRSYLSFHARRIKMIRDGEAASGSPQTWSEERMKFHIYLPGCPVGQPFQPDAVLTEYIEERSFVILFTTEELRLQDIEPPVYTPPYHAPRPIARAHPVAAPAGPRRVPTYSWGNSAEILAALRPFTQVAGRDHADEERDVGNLASLPIAIVLLAAARRYMTDMPMFQDESYEDVKKVIAEPAFDRLCAIFPHPPVVASEDFCSEECCVEDETAGGPNDAGLGVCTICQLLLSSRRTLRGELRQTPVCRHVFHAKCLRPWLTQNAITCPTCRAEISNDPADCGYLGIGNDSESVQPPL